MSLTGYEIQIDASNVVVTNTKVKLTARIYLNGIYECDHHVMLRSAFYQQTIQLPDGIDQIKAVVARRVADHLNKTQQEALAVAQDALKLGANKVRLT